MRILVGLLALALAFSGCSDDGGDGGSGGDGGNGGDGTTSTTTTTTTTPPPEETFTPVYINGTVTGVADCDVPNAAGTAMGSSNPVTPDMWNRTWELSKTDDPSGAGSLCLAFSDGTIGTTSGTVPADVDTVVIYATGGQIGYSLLIS